MCARRSPEGRAKLAARASAPPLNAVSRSATVSAKRLRGSCAQPGACIKTTKRKKCERQQTGRKARLNPRHQTQRGCDEASTEEIDPSLMPGNPSRNDRRDSFGFRKMFRAEGRDRRRVKKRPEENQFVESSRFAPIPSQKKRGQPDGKHHSKCEIRPDHLARNRNEGDYRPRTRRHRIRQDAAHR